MSWLSRLRERVAPATSASRILVPEEVVQPTLLLGRHGRGIPNERLALSRTEQNEAGQDRRGQHRGAQAEQQAAARSATGQPPEGCADTQDTAGGREQSDPTARARSTPGRSRARVRRP